jgi:ribose/xylose/arabinose/galactoside ABC-type transport system permease subunit
MHYSSEPGASAPKLEAKESAFRKTLRKIDYTTFGPIMGLIFIFILFSIISPPFLSFNNIVNILRQVSIIGIMAIGVTFVIIMAEIDLSIASTMPLSGIIAGAAATGGYLMPFKFPVWAAILIGLLIGALFGWISGMATAKLKIPSFMATLSMMFIIEGFMLWFSGAKPLYGLPDSLQWFGAGKLMGIPAIILIFAIVFIVSDFVLRKTVFGRNIYAIGGNEEAARMSGINVDKYKIWVLTICGLLSAFAGILMLGRIGSAQVTAGVGLQLPPIAAVILGGTSLFGGIGSMRRTLVGVLLMGVLVNGLNLLGVGSDGQKLATGIVLIIAVATNVMGTVRK